MLPSCLLAGILLNWFFPLPHICAFFCVCEKFFSLVPWPGIFSATVILCSGPSQQLCALVGFVLHECCSVYVMYGFLYAFWHQQLHGLPAHVAWPKPVVGQSIICCENTKFSKAIFFPLSSNTTLTKHLQSRTVQV